MEDFYHDLRTFGFLPVYVEVEDENFKTADQEKGKGPIGYESGGCPVILVDDAEPTLEYIWFEKGKDGKTAEDIADEKNAKNSMWAENNAEVKIRRMLKAKNSKNP